MKAAKNSPTEDGSELQNVFSAACAIEARQRQVAMAQDDLRVQMTAARLILISGEDLSVGPAVE